MNKSIYPLLVAQFLSVFADNTLLFTVIAMVMQKQSVETWYVPALQSVFLLAFVILAPWLGTFADARPKARVLILANLIKFLGAGLLLLNLEPLMAYAIVGVGAAVYSPAKYGLLPELAEHRHLVKANSWIEGSTILAILTGMAAGAKVADQSIFWALVMAMALLLASVLVSLAIPAPIPAKSDSRLQPLKLFYRECINFLKHPRSRFTVLGGCLFWGTAASVRVILVAWAPLVLHSQTASDISELTLFLAIGIILGSAFAPLLMPLAQLRRTRVPAYLLGMFIIALSFVEEIWLTRGLLLGIGTVGGLFVVPINAALQEIGQRSIGSGSAVALQNFFQNVAMLLTVGIYTLAAFLGLNPIEALSGLGSLELLAAVLLMRSLAALF